MSSLVQCSVPGLVFHPSFDESLFQMFREFFCFIIFFSRFCQDCVARVTILDGSVLTRFTKEIKKEKVLRKFFSAKIFSLFLFKKKKNITILDRTFSICG